MDHSVEFSARASLVALGVRFQQLGTWSVIQAQVQIKQKVLKYQPVDKLLDCFINILAGVSASSRSTPACVLTAPCNGRSVAAIVPTNRRSVIP